MEKLDIQVIEKEIIIVEDEFCIKAPNGYKIVDFYGEYGIVECITNNEKYFCFINKKGEFINENKYTELEYVSNDTFIFKSYDGYNKRGIIENLEELFDTIYYDNIEKTKSNNLFLASTKYNCYYLIDKTGRKLLKEDEMPKQMVVEDNIAAYIKHKNCGNYLIIYNGANKKVEEIRIHFDFDIIILNDEFIVLRDFEKTTFNEIDKDTSDVSYVDDYRLAYDSKNREVIIDKKLNVLADVSGYECDKIWKDCYCSSSSQSILDFNSNVLYEFDIDNVIIYREGLNTNAKYKIWFDIKNKKEYRTKYEIIYAINKLAKTWKFEGLIKTKEGLLDLESKFHIPEVFDNIYITGEYVIFNNEYIVPISRLKDLKIKKNYQLIIVNGKETKILNFDNKRKFNTAKKIAEQYIEELKNYCLTKMQSLDTELNTITNSKRNNKTLTRKNSN